jgi:hypothetical protein
LEFGLKAQRRLGALVSARRCSAKAGILPGDVIVGFNGRCPNRNEPVKMVIATKPDRPVSAA